MPRPVQSSLIAKLKAAKHSTQGARETLSDMEEILRMQQAYLQYVEARSEP
jgi:hypothetical protein